MSLNRIRLKYAWIYFQETVKFALNYTFFITLYCSIVTVVYNLDLAKHCFNWQFITIITCYTLPFSAYDTFRFIKK